MHDNLLIALSGGSSGIGLETVTKFLAQGALVVNGDLNQPLIIENNKNLSFVEVDVTSWEQLSALFEKTIELHGRVDHVFANAGELTSCSVLVPMFTA